ncbi:DUF1737 domain-containing protein [Shimwellia blattae]|uniref:DUF1737 domain-containing protein n=1 Tax=Shimwellia blattae (strain ATCC 29907 / DSM 4481 / JCM 1650 / NBRC 105725 / CDC 9005-74) TaxID=630626 RepID=I2B9S2_SHIBC|nr:DUF1737 domain-containing protein [Shimwellia blattae]AFJ47276.1 hypothetical protein EBL_c21850 [Shimwellia blattae DSM 4481 = NBRC 105725]GAB80531.1 hypothetical protein EB105725_05_02600 [Shimwellia blattae DSM 4481 = NBRC 105725]VDY64767.1 Domain of uncharacterised function (DUF1737) [Shimwellia blattae]VEC22866.1 Domain of uncharacterised function (DUF1737) [Shimwellia blattae]
MPVTSMQAATAGSAVDLVNVVTANMANNFYPFGSLKSVHATVGGKVEYFQQIGAGITRVNRYEIVVSNDRAEFTEKVNGLLSSGWALLGDMCITQLTPGRTCQYAQALTMTFPS